MLLGVHSSTVYSFVGEPMTKQEARKILRECWGSGWKNQTDPRSITEQERAQVNAVLNLYPGDTILDKLLRIAEIDFDWRNTDYDKRRDFFASVE